MVCRQSKQKNSSTNPLAITIHTSQHNKIHNVYNMAAFSWQKSRLRGGSLEAGSLLSRAGRCKASVYSAMLSSSKECPARQNREDNVNKNVKSKPFPSPTTAPKIWSGRNQHLKCVFYEINEIMCVLMLSRYFRYSIGSTGRIHRDKRR